MSVSGGLQRVPFHQHPQWNCSVVIVFKYAFLLSSLGSCGLLGPWSELQVYKLSVPEGLFEFYSLLIGSAHSSSTVFLDLCPTHSLQEPFRSAIWIISAIAYKPRQHQMLANSQDKKNKVLIAFFTWSEGRHVQLATGFIQMRIQDTLPLSQGCTFFKPGYLEVSKPKLCVSWFCSSTNTRCWRVWIQGAEREVMILLNLWKFPYDLKATFIHASPIFSFL